MIYLQIWYKLSPCPVGIQATAIPSDSTVLTATNEHPTWWVTEGLFLYCYCSVERRMYSNDCVRQVVWWLQAQIPYCQQTWASDRYVVQKVCTINLVSKLVMKVHLFNILGSWLHWEPSRGSVAPDRRSPTACRSSWSPCWSRCLTELHLW